MSSDSTIYLISPLHDPNARLTKMLTKHGEKLHGIYGRLAAISVTPDTSPTIVDMLSKLNFKYEILQENSTNLADNVRSAIKMGLEMEASHLHFIDFDRALHWTKQYEQELQKIRQTIMTLSGYTSLVRTQKAFESHPFVQRATETTVNAIASKLAGRNVDIMSGSFAMDKNAATIFLAQSTRQSFDIYAEILKIVVDNKIKINTLEVNGLEWETPDQFTQKIEEEGYIAWLNEFESLEEWQKRAKIIEGSVDVLI